MTLVMDNVPLGQRHYDTCYEQSATGTVIMTLVMDTVPVEQSHYDTCYRKSATGTVINWLKTKVALQQI